MPKICYQPKRFNADAESVITTAVGILENYAAQGYDLTLRQLYYQFVSRALIPNRDSEYKRLGGIINDARLAGRIDWDHITDRTRNLRQNAHWTNPQAIIEACGSQFRLDRWVHQPTYVEVWVEKDALVGVLEVACRPLDLPYFSCRGYTSQSEMWAAAMRLLGHVRRGKQVCIIHLGDHDPSGIDMTRDVEERISGFISHHYPMAGFRVDRVALNMDQIEHYNPPPNPAKVTDSRSEGYIRRFGESSWELDALEPSVISELIQSTAHRLIDQGIWDDVVAKEDAHKHSLQRCAERWDGVLRYLEQDDRGGE